MANTVYTLDLDGFKALARDHRRLEHEVENLKRLLSHVNVEAAPAGAMIVKPDDAIPAMSSTGGFSEGDATIYRPVRGGGPVGAGSALDGDTLYSAESTQKVINISQAAISSTEFTLAIRESPGGRMVVGAVIADDLEFGTANAAIAGLTTAGNAVSGTFTAYTISSTGGLTSATTTLTGWNVQASAISATSTGSPYFLLHRHRRTGRYIIDPPPHVVEIARADSSIAACSTAGTAGSGTCSIYTLSTANVLTDTNVNVTAYNLSVDTVASGVNLQLVRHYRTGKWLVNYEDCATT